MSKKLAGVVGAGILAIAFVGLAPSFTGGTFGNVMVAPDAYEAAPGDEVIESTYVDFRNPAPGEIVEYDSEGDIFNLSYTVDVGELEADFPDADNFDVTIYEERQNASVTWNASASPPIGITDDIIVQVGTEKFNSSDIPTGGGSIWYDYDSEEEVLQITHERNISQMKGDLPLASPDPIDRNWSDGHFSLYGSISRYSGGSFSGFVKIQEVRFQIREAGVYAPPTDEAFKYIVIVAVLAALVGMVVSRMS